MKIPVIGAQAGGVPDVIADGSDGLLVRYGDPNQLAAAIEPIAGQPRTAANDRGAWQAESLGNPHMGGFMSISAPRPSMINCLHESYLKKMIG